LFFDFPSHHLTFEKKIPIVKLNGTKSSASLWLKEKKNEAGSSVFIWIFEEVFESQSSITIDHNVSVFFFFFFFFFFSSQ
jgi:hypothetical protein